MSGNNHIEDVIFARESASYSTERIHKYIADKKRNDGCDYRNLFALGKACKVRRGRTSADKRAGAFAPAMC